MTKAKSFAGFVEDGLRRRSISLRKLCRDSGMDPSFLSKVIREKISPPTDQKLIKKLAQVLGLDPIVLIISTGLIPMELRGDPEKIKHCLERVEPARGNYSKPSAKSVPAPSPQAPSIFKSPHLSEDLL